MMVPRSYPFLLQSPPSKQHPRHEKMGARSPPPRSPFPKPMRALPSHTKEERARSPEPRQVTPQAPMHSKPVVIPPRTPARTSSATATQSVKVRGHNGGRPQRSSSSKTHNPNAIPPAVAALLAVTAIPKMPTRRRKGSATPRRISMDELIHEWKQDESELPASVVGSPLDLLLGRVDESEEEYGSLVSEEQEKDCAQSVTDRSISSDSLYTIPPSLDTDAPSFTSHWDELSTPDSYQRSLPDRRGKVVSSPPAEDCVLDHPLLHFTPDDCEDMANFDIPDPATPSPPSERFRSFKSNLTASLQALKSAAKSFSNFTAPSVPPDDLLTRSLLSPKFTSEMRPKHIQGLPSPELRRYLNPTPAPVSPTELSMQLYDALAMDIDEDTSAPMIQMQTYERRNRSRGRRKSNDPFSEAGRAQSEPPAVRQREPRENSDFLRVIVLEMNMRRVGKLDSKAVGKARIWLPPRKLGASRAPSVQGPASRVPDRWVSVLAEQA